jgi:GPI mannosyltransferase 3
MAGGAVARIAFALYDDGINWPDEVYQSLEPAHRAVFGYGWQAWEFVEGARNWTLPGLVTGLLELAKAMGWAHPRQYLSVVEFAFCGAGVATVWAVAVLARALGASDRSGAIAAWTFAMMGLAVYFAPRAMGETLSALPLTLGLAAIARPDSKTRDIVLAGALLSFAVWLRLQHGLFALAACAMLLARRRFGHLGVLLAVLGVGAAGYGAIDWVSWGAPFHSARVYLRFNLVEGRSSAWGSAPWFRYLGALVTSDGVVFIPLVMLAALAHRRTRWLNWTALVFLAVHSAIPHKELRFLFPLIPLVCAQAAVGLDEALRRWPSRRRVLSAGLMMTPVVSLVTLPTLTFGRLGATSPGREVSALDFAGPENRLLIDAGARPDVCGLKIATIESWRTGGYTFFHKPVPLYRRDPPEIGLGHYNYVIARRGSVVGEEMAVDGALALVRLGGTCAPDPAYGWRLE